MFFGSGDNGQDWQDEHEEEETGVKKEVNTTEFYELMDITKDATTEQIKKAFRKKALKEHPDKGGDPVRFARLKQAYQTLLDPEKRQLYDEYGEEGVKNGGPPGASGNIFDFFNQKSDNRPKKMKPLLVNLEVTLEQIYFGKMKNVSVKRLRICEQCEGKGGKNVQVCSTCKGQGASIKLKQVGPGMYAQVQQKCADCSGRGQKMTQEDKCKTCEGKKVIQKEKQLEVAVEPGVPDSHDYIFTGESNQIPGVMAGDVYARISIQKHQLFQRRGADLVYRKDISLLEALTGVTFTLKHLDGKQYLISTAPGQILQNKQLKTLKRLGLPFYKDPMNYGHLYVQFTVKFPQANNFNQEQEERLRKSFGQKKYQPELLTNTQNAFPLEDFSEDLLNPKSGPEQEQEEQEGNGGIACQQQ